jgi:indolepyruvate ferredoxin oxidoreductase beta subunit
MTFNLMIAGVGGQGTVLASKLIAAAAMKKNYSVRTTETIGMAQRGGCVTSHVRICATGGDGLIDKPGLEYSIFSPLIPLGMADAIIAFEPAEAVRQLPYLSAQGTMIVCDSAIAPSGASPSGGSGYTASTMIDYLKSNVSKLTIINGEDLTNTEGFNSKTLNVALLGAAAESGIFPFDIETIKQVIPEMLPERFWELNLTSLETGRKILEGKK